MPKISIAMTTYNGEKYIREQLDSILSQTIQDFELIICDDKSFDSTVKILEEYAKKDNRIKVFVNEKNLGFLRNFEKAFSFCAGEYIAMCDQDDIWLPEHLEILYKNICEINCDLCGANALLVDSQNKELGATMMNAFAADKMPQNQDEYKVRILYTNIFQGAACIFKNALLQKALPFPDGVKYHDWWLALIAVFNGGVNWSSEIVLRYRQHNANASSGGSKFEIVKQLVSHVFSKKKRDEVRQTRQELLVLLYALKTKIGENETLLTAINFNENLQQGRKIRALKYFNKHYHEMNLTSKNGFLRLFRMIKLLMV